MPQLRPRSLHNYAQRVRLAMLAGASSAAAAFAVAALAVAACAPRETTAPLTLVEVVSPTGPGAAEPNLFTARDGRVLMSWLEPADSGAHALRLSVMGPDGTWSAPVDVVRRSDLFVNWADFPSVVALEDGRFLAHWLQRNGSGKYAYEVRMAESRDQGVTWSASVTPHRAGVEAEHGFVSLLPDSAGGALVVFLDGGANVIAGASTAGDAPASGDAHEEHGVPMSVSANSWDAAMTEATKSVLDALACDCCQTAAAMTGRGAAVIYRDRTEGEIRDIAIVRRVNGEWTAPAIVHADNWELNACPVNGPAIVASGDDVAIAWFTGARDTAKVQVIFSHDAGATFGAPVRVDAGNPAGRVGLQWLNGKAYVSWLERGAGDTAFVQVRPVTREGVAREPITVTTSSGARSSGFPRMTRLNDGLLFAYTLPGAPSVVKMTTLRTAP